MSIKSTIRKLETQMSKKHGTSSTVFLVPYCSDEKEGKEIERQIMQENDLANSELLIVFVIDYAA